MRNLITTITLLAVLRSPAAIAQTTGNAKSSVGPATQSSSLMPEMRLMGAPVGHRQPRARDIPSENSSSSKIENIAAEDAATDRRINAIRRGC